MSKIKFTDGIWTAVIANDFITDNVARLAKAASVWLLNKNKESSVVIGYDARFGGKLFSEAVAKVFALMGIKVYITTSVVSTAMISLAVIKKNASLGVFITANNEKPKYNGIILLDKNGTSLNEIDLKLIESLIPSLNEIDLTLLKWHEYENQGFIEYYNIEKEYINYLTNKFNLTNYNELGTSIVFDTLHGNSRNIINKLFTKSKVFNETINPFFKNTETHPGQDNLKELETYIKSHKGHIGIAFSSDAKYISIYTENIEYLNSYQVFMLLIHYLGKYKKFKGDILIDSHITKKVQKLASHYGLSVNITEPNTANFENQFIQKNALLGINNKNEIFVHSEIPQPDGILSCLIFAEILNETNKTISDLYLEVKEITGKFIYESVDIKTNNSIRNKIIKLCKEGNLYPLGLCETVNNNDNSAYKFNINQNDWLLIAPKKQGFMVSIFTQKISNQETIEKIKEVEKIMIP